MDFLEEWFLSQVPAPPPLPSLVPKPPPPPPPPLGPPVDFEKRALNEKQKATIEKLKTRPRRRPDWSEMMKEVEEGKKLRHVQCNDRSQPIITCKSMTKVDDKFVYETEKDNAHNKLLKQIQGGIRLKSVKTNDRSKPFLDGLRKFRRQMTIEEQIQKSESKANLHEVPQEPDEPSGDELDDIDKLRDDLQSTKQMLALELRNREAQERENKRLLAKIANLEAELQRDKTRGGDKDESSSAAAASSSSSGADDVLVQSLKKDAEEARKTSKELEKKYEKSAEELDAAKNEVEEQKRMIQQLEKKLSQALQQSPSSNAIRPQFSFCYSFEDPSDSDIYYNLHSTSESEIQQEEPPPQINNIKHISNHITNCMNSLKGGGSSMNGSRRPSEANPNKESSPELELELSESEEDEDEEKKAERKKRRLAKEVKILQTKLTKLKDKQEAAKRERANLKQIMKKNHVLLKEENKKFKKLEKEVHKMAASMKEEVDDDDEEKDDEEEEEEEAEEEEESEEESEEDSESEESEEESGSETESESEAEDATDEDKKTNLEPRVKKHENRLSALKKGNVLLQANVDNLQDEISKVREKASSLQAELDSVLADLGL
ncbi:glutamic acid-rich protein isoform X4 [Episyrphus balteatus]|uniref:glutamic acid-rich protein isoform X4 n=1 Tax=Episyrphus balteatus TaxID=286459 RepID=UPI00248520EB|nr:glutamic acid-rich protein isoform X4 [Episyrphus balteatus]